MIATATKISSKDAPRRREECQWDNRCAVKETVAVMTKDFHAERIETSGRNRREILTSIMPFLSDPSFS